MKRKCRITRITDPVLIEKLRAAHRLVMKRAEEKKLKDADWQPALREEAKEAG